MGGEKVPEELAHILLAYDEMLPYVIYGCTEVTGIGTIEKITDMDKELTIGEAPYNVVAQIRDIDGRILPPGVVGEIYIGGCGVSKGYYNLDEKSQESFININNIPFYKTGHPNLTFNYCGYYGSQQLYREDIDDESTYIVTVEAPCCVMGRVNYGTEKGELELNKEEYEEFKKNPKEYIKEHYEEIDTDFKVEDYDIDYREPMSFNDISYNVEER